MGNILIYLFIIEREQENRNFTEGNQLAGAYSLMIKTNKQSKQWCRWYQRFGNTAAQQKLRCLNHHEINSLSFSPVSSVFQRQFFCVYMSKHQEILRFLRHILSSTITCRWRGRTEYSWEQHWSLLSMIEAGFARLFTIQWQPSSWS